FGLSWPRAVEAAFLLGQAAEFAFVIVATARAGGVIPAATATSMLLVTALSIFLTPVVASVGGRFAQKAMGKAAHAPPSDAAKESGHVVIAGFGRVGQTLSDLLNAQEIGNVAIDSDTALVSELQRKGRNVHYG